MAKCKYCGLDFKSEEELQAHKEKSHKAMMKLDGDPFTTTGSWQERANRE